MVTPDILEEFKERMHITHSAEDSNLQRLLSFSFVDIKGKCGQFDLSGEQDVDLRGKELVFERTRYVYNDALEYFENNFISQLNSLSLDIALKEGVVDEGI